MLIKLHFTIKAVYLKRTALNILHPRNSNFYKQQTAQNIIEIGKRLIKAKEQLAHGEWGKWLEEKVEFKSTTASKYMRVAREFSNFQTCENLTQSKIFTLLELPSEDREEFLEENPVEDMTTRELMEAIKAKKQAEERAKELEHAAELQNVKRTKRPLLNLKKSF